MDKEIFTPESLKEERELILKLCNIVSEKKGDEMQRRIVRSFNDPFDIFRQVRCDPADSEDSYTDLRLKALVKLVYMIGNNINGEHGAALTGKRESGISEALLNDALSKFDFRSCEKLVVLFCDDSYSVKAVYESEDRDIFGCKVDNERLKRCIKQNSPCNMIMIHSHPESAVVASADDIRFTQSIMAYAESLGSSLAEHFVIPCAGGTDDCIGILEIMRNEADADPKF